MLLILYGATAEMGHKSREYLIKSGYQLIEKYSFAPKKPNLSTIYGKRNYVSESEFYENTDSLFRYEVGGIMVGFNQNQISDAVCDKSNSLLTLSTDNISFLAEIKRIYVEKVCLIYVYIDDASLKNIISGFENITDEEIKVRYETGKAVKQCYLKNGSLFDRVVIYGGEESDFNYAALYAQYDNIIRSFESKGKKRNQYSDIFISYTLKDTLIFNEIKGALVKRRLSVFAPNDLEGQEFASVITDAIQNAKIVIPVITKNVLSSKWACSEIEIILECAENNGTLLLPVIEENLNIEKVGLAKLKSIDCLSPVIIKGNLISKAAEKLSEMISKLFSAESNLMSLSKQVDNYLCLNMFSQAIDLQKEHLSLCDEVYLATNGLFIDYEVCIMSRIKLTNILLHMNRNWEALDSSIETLNMLKTKDNMYDVVVEEFIMCCFRMDLKEEIIYKIINERLVVTFQLFNKESLIKDFMERFRKKKNNEYINMQKHIVEEIPVEEDENKIAQHGETVIALFEELMQESTRNQSRHNLILGYERILNYCKYMGLKGEIADKCISRIAELSSFNELQNGDNNSNIINALKIYLGQAIPQSGEYDVFLSYKSEDTILAQKVFEYLAQSGKEVFFSKETLPHLGESEYEEMIFEAIDRSKHMVLIGSNPDYLKTAWVKDEWSTFNNEIREGRKNGNLILLLSDDIASDKGRLPCQLRQKEIVKMSEFRNRLLSYLR